MVRLRVRELAEERGFNMSSLARKADIGFSTVKRMWKNPYQKANTEILEKIARALGVPIASLIEDVPDPDE